MARCHECDSEVAQNDVFCPYCGISLQPVPIPALEEEDDSMASTMMMPMGPSVANSTSPASKEPGQSQQGQTKVPDSEGEHKSFLPDELPIPPVPGEARDTYDNLGAKATGEYGFGKTDDSRLPRPFSSTGSVPESAPPKSIPTEEPSENIKTEQSVDVPGDLPTSQPPDFSPPAAEQRTSGGEAAIEDWAGFGSPPAAPQPSPELQQERPVYEDESITKPDDELQPPELASPGSRFDSVRIMENKPGGSQEDVDTRIQPGVQPTPAPTPPAPVLLDPANQPEVRDPKPYTTPNIGIGDTDGKRAAKLKPLSEGAILNGRYEIIRKIGGGGMGAVYLASDNNLGGVLRAVKEMVQAHIEEEQQDKAVNDFKRESMILSTLDHPSVPTIFDYFYDEKESRFYLVMKYISGGDLAARLRSAPEGKIDEKTVTEWAIQIADVLNYLHSQPSTIVYRDLKPSNVMIDGNSGRVMLIDFGIARSISQKEEKGVTAVGTMGYAPPELFSGNVEPRSDIYSLGSTMFHLLTGADPQSNPLLIFDFQKNPRPRQINPRLSDQMERILMRSVEYNADQRFSSAAEMRQVLEDHLLKLKTGQVTYGVSEAPKSVSLAYQSVFCGFCGQRIVATDMFCAFCGAKQPIAQQGVHAEIYAHPSPTAKLIVEGTSELTTPAFSLQKDEVLLGRRDPMSNIFPEVDLSKFDPQTKISRRHARIWREGNNFLVEDLGSSNGTILEPLAKDPLKLMPRRPHMLGSGDRIKIGDTTLHFLVG